MGLGDSSVKKNYYPVLQEKIRDLEEKQKLLMETVRTLEERETELEQLLDEKTVLLQEVNHRVKNNLQIITSLFYLGEEGAGLKELASFRKTLKRIETISVIYQECIFSENYTEVTMLHLLKILAFNIRTEAEMPLVEFNFIFPMDEIIISIDDAVPLAMIANEVITNSFEHAFPEGRGTVDIEISSSQSGGHTGMFELEIRDSGSRVFDIGKVKKSMGMQLVSALAMQLADEFSYSGDKDGTLFRIEVKSV